MPKYRSKEEGYEVIGRLAAKLQASEKLKVRLPLNAISVGFTLTDLGARFVLRLSRDQISAAPGVPTECPVSVSLTSSTFDQIFSGQRDAESAYMYGLLSLRGSEYRAEQLLPYMPEIVAAYKAATA